MSDLPNFAAWSHENLAKFAVDSYRLMQQQQEQGQPQAEAVAALRAHLAQDDAASLKQDLKALARLLEHAMLDGGEEIGEDNGSSTTASTTTIAICHVYVL